MSSNRLPVTLVAICSFLLAPHSSAQAQAPLNATFTFDGVGMGANADPTVAADKASTQAAQDAILQLRWALLIYQMAGWTVDAPNPTGAVQKAVRIDNVNGMTIVATTWTFTFTVTMTPPPSNPFPFPLFPPIYPYPY